MKQLLILLTLFLVAACGSKASEEQADALKKEVFKIHDDVMPQTMKIEDIQASVRAKFEKDSSLKTQGMAVNAAMQAATDSMYVWMGTLSNFDDMGVEEKTKFLEIQKIKGQTIKEATSRSINEANAFLK